MKIICPKYEILSPDLDDPTVANDIYQRIELAGRTCYKSEDRITPESAEKFVRMIVRNNHEAMLEHASMTVRFTVDRAVSHELVRHRLASFAQESQRYINYGTDNHELTFIRPWFFKSCLPEVKGYWMDCMKMAEDRYLAMIDAACTPQEARSVLPNSTKTEIIVTANLREWRHIFRLRAAGETGMPHPGMLEVMLPLFNECKLKLPAVFDDIRILEIIRNFNGG